MVNLLQLHAESQHCAETDSFALSCQGHIYPSWSQMRIEGPRVALAGMGSEIEMPEHMKEGFLRDMTLPVAVGERVNSHVIEAVRQQEPDYEAMRRIIVGDEMRVNRAADDKAA